MTKRSSELIGFGLLSALSLILWTDILAFFNTSLPDTVIGNALGSFFWLVYPILVLWLIVRTIMSIF